MKSTKYIGMDVHGDAGQPGGKMRFTTELVQMAVGFDECFLHRILSVLDLPQHRERDPKHTSLVAPYKGLKSLPVAAENALNEAQILRSSVRLAVLRSFRHLQNIGSVLMGKRFKDRRESGPVCTDKIPLYGYQNEAGGIMWERYAFRFSHSLIFTLLIVAMGAVYSAFSQGNAPAQLANGPAKPGFDINRFASNGGMFKTFDVEQTESLQKALQEGKVAEETPVLITATAGGNMALLTEQMVFHHLAQGRAGAKDWMAAF